MPFYKGKSYKLVITNEGDLHLYDALESLIWCTGKDCLHRDGYIFPELYLVPTDFETKEIDGDKHNSIDKSIILLNQSSIVSLDHDCESQLESGYGLTSENKRFKLILEESGNLILKDGHRTMWESFSGYLPYAVGPFKLIVAPSGNLLIKSSNGFIVWESVNTFNVSTYFDNFDRLMNDTAWPYTLSVEDFGCVQVKNAFDDTVWESWPINNISKMITHFYPNEYYFVDCDGKPPINKYNLCSNDKNKSSQCENILRENEKLVSKVNFWDLVILDRSLLVIRKLNVIVNV